MPTPPGPAQPDSPENAADHLRAVFDAALEFAVVLAPGGTVVDANRAALVAIGASMEDVVGCEFWACAWWTHDPELQSRVRDAVARVALGGDSVTIETWQRGPSGQPRVVDVELRALSGRDGRIERILAEARNVSARVQVEAALATSERRYRDLFERNGAVQILIDPVTSRLVDANPAAEQFYGYPGGVLTTLTVAAVNGYTEAQQEAVSARIVAGEITFVRRRHQLASGEWRDVDVHTGPVHAGGRALLHSIIHDVTERVAAETERDELADRLKHSEAELRALFGAMTDIVLVLDEHGTYERVIPTAIERLILPPAQLIGRRLDELFPAAVAARMLDAIERALGTRSRVLIDYPVDLPNGTSSFTATVSPLSERTVLWVARDVTEQTRLEAELRQAHKMDAIGQLAGGIAHDFNNLLTAIRCTAELAQAAAAAGQPVTDDLVQIRAAADRAAAVTRQLLAFSRRQMLQPVALDANVVVRAIAPMLDRMLGRDIVVQCALVDALPAIRADAGQLEQVIMNLAINARDAMVSARERSGRRDAATSLPDAIRIATADCTLATARTHAHGVVPPGRYVVLSVADCGAGIDPAALPHIFEPFFTTKAQGQGTGLGLATVHGIVHQSGGNLVVETTPETGTTFLVYLPALPAVPPSAAQPPVDAAALVAPATATEASAARVQDSRRVVLVVDDEEPVRLVAARALGRAGHRVLTAESAEHALRMIAADPIPPALVLTDLVMPGMGGRALGDTLGLRYPATRVLYMSGYTKDDIFRQGLLDASRPFLQKPFSIVALVEAVGSALTGAQEGAIDGAIDGATEGANEGPNEGATGSEALPRRE